MPDTDPDDFQTDPDTGVHGPRRRWRKEPRKRLSDLLDEIAADTTQARISVADLLRRMDGRAFGALLLLFALPNVLPAPPGTSGILGLPLVYLSAQMMLGHLPWLPPFIANRSLPREDFARIVAQVSPTLARTEKLLIPRGAFMTHPRVEQAVGVLCLILSVVLVLPIPLGNMLPAFAICILSLGMLERDALWIGFGLGVALLSLLVVWGVVFALLKAFLFILASAFS